MQSPKLIIYVLMSNAGRVAGIWNGMPSEEQKIKAYSAYLGKEVDANAVSWGTWVEMYYPEVGELAR